MPDNQFLYLYVICIYKIYIAKILIHTYTIKLYVLVLIFILVINKIVSVGTELKKNKFWNIHLSWIWHFILFALFCNLIVNSKSVWNQFFLYDMSTTQYNALHTYMLSVISLIQIHIITYIIFTYHTIWVKPTMVTMNIMKCAYFILFSKIRKLKKKILN